MKAAWLSADRARSHGRSALGYANSVLIVPAACCFLLLIILLHANLVDSGQWQGDEYDYAASVRDHGLSFFFYRVLHVRPRPLSELLLFGYAECVNIFHRPLIGAFLSLNWALFLFGCCAWLFKSGQISALRRVFLALALVCLFLLGHPIADMFFWPVGIAPYGLTIAAICFLLMEMLDGGTERTGGMVWCACSMLVAALSSEIGAFVVFFFSGLYGLHSLVTRLPLPPRRLAWILIPMAASVAVLVGAILGPAAMAPTLPTRSAHDIVVSLQDAIGETAREFVMVDPDDGGWGQSGRGSMVLGVPIKLALLVGFAFFIPRGFVNTRVVPIASLFLALLIAQFLSIASAYYQFGFQCCQRHETLRGCLGILELFAVAITISNKSGITKEWPAVETLGVLCVIGPIAFMGLWRWPNLVKAYDSRIISEQSLDVTWRSGQSADRYATVVQQPEAVLVHAWTIHSGHYDRSHDTAYDTVSIMRFFKKAAISVQSADEFKRSGP